VVTAGRAGRREPAASRPVTAATPLGINRHRARSLSLAALLLTVAACGENPAYGEQCRDLAAEVSDAVGAIAAEHGACSADADCTWVAASVPCSRDNPHPVAIATAELEAVRADVRTLGEDRCSEQTIQDCNAHCGCGGDLYFPGLAVGCSAGTCEGESGPAAPTGSLDAAELCTPSRFVTLPEEM